MPITDDLIKRALDQLASLSGTITGDSPDLAEAERTLKAAYREHTGSEAALLRQLPSAQLLDVLSSAGVLDKEKAFLIAALLETDIALQRAKGEVPSAALQLKVLDLYLEAALADIDVPEVHTNVERVRGELQGFVLPPATQWRLHEYAAAQGQYAAAEDALFGLLETLGNDPDVAARGRQFYARLQTLSEADLVAGGLPKKEVAEGAASFEEEVAS